MLNSILNEAIGVQCSDIHIEPGALSVSVRMRIDGKLLDRFQIRKQDFKAIVNQIKIRGGMDIAEKRLPQDGRFEYSYQNVWQSPLSALLHFLVSPPHRGAGYQ